MTWKDEVRQELLRYQKETDSDRFTLQEFYQFSEGHLSAAYPNNNHVRAKIRQVLQQLRDAGELKFVDGEGNYSTRADEGSTANSTSQVDTEADGEAGKQSEADTEKIDILEEMDSDFDHL